MPKSTTNYIEHIKKTYKSTCGMSYGGLKAYNLLLPFLPVYWGLWGLVVSSVWLDGRRVVKGGVDPERWVTVGDRR